jgi:quinolinate synthase
MGNLELQNQIRTLKIEKEAVILAHYYQPPEIQDIADHVGDSLGLSILAKESPEDLIVFCGVDFMAETAKLLSPEKRVLLPVKDASCPMAEMATEADVRRLKDQYPDAAVVSYVNSTTAVKALSDICCTSANIVSILRSLPQRQIIFLPDENLGSFAASELPEKEIILFNGYCCIHNRVQEMDVILQKRKHPQAKVVVHPECRPPVRNLADFVGSTGQMIQFVSRSNDFEFIIGTECGILHPLEKQNPDKSFHMLRKNFICRSMKKITLNHVLHSLESMQHEITIRPDFMESAKRPLEKMLDISK